MIRILHFNAAKYYSETFFTKYLACVYDESSQQPEDVDLKKSCKYG